MSTMTEHYFKNGGLAAVEGFIPDATPFTPNEWYNALQDGYLDQAMLHNFKHAGLASVDSVDVDAIAATPQELFWAVRDGYGQDFVQHVFRKGGV